TILTAGADADGVAVGREPAGQARADPRRRPRHQHVHGACSLQWSGGGTSSVGLRSKNPNGTSENPAYSTGITGQSSGRGMWVTPNVCHSTTSVSTRERSAAVHWGNPSPPPDWFGCSPAARRS